MWRGRVHGRVGTFKFIHVKLLDEGRRKLSLSWENGSRNDSIDYLGVRSVLTTAGLSHLAPLLILNGYDTVQELVEIAHRDLDYLGVTENELEKICAAATSLLASMQVSSTASAPQHSQTSVPPTSRTSTGILDQPTDSAKSTPESRSRATTPSGSLQRGEDDRPADCSMTTLPLPDKERASDNIISNPQECQKSFLYKYVEDSESEIIIIRL
jgi:hypothetical protein